ncbi:HAD hydrolase family protein [Staphylococcus sp. GDY8P85P]|uniref:HAD family hydrolase n=1 Tax=Staphylococcus sp. GDY8P85P TaxID=2804138 RepID=UPI001FD90ECC|nr:HAD hydrolase family protein [Staphylococcus sp. GDY8P85P]
MYLDIDGTICFDGRQIDNEIVERLLSLHNIGCTVIFASARPIRDLIPVLPKQFHLFPLIGGNGSIVSINGHIRPLATIQPKSFKVIKDVINHYALDYIVDDQWDYAARVDESHTIFRRLNILINLRLLNLSLVVSQPILHLVMITMILRCYNTLRLAIL